MKKPVNLIIYLVDQLKTKVTFNNMSDLKSQVNTLKTLVKAEKFDSDKAGSILKELKLKLLHSKYLTNEESSMSLDERALYRSVLECDAIYNVKISNLKHFQLDMQKLKSVYFRTDSGLPKSEEMPILLSIYLVYLLTQNQIVEFNLELPLVRKIVGQNDLIEFAVNLERAVVDNSFTQLFSLENRSPSPLFKNLTVLLLNGARNNHADSIEKAYKDVSVAELANILHFANLDEAKEFIAKRNWKLSPDGGTISFHQAEEKEKKPVDQAERYVDLAVAISSIQ